MLLEALASVLNVVFEPCYQLTGNYWVAIALFTAIIKLILMPLSLWCQWNSIVMVKLMPALNRVKVKYFGDQERIGEAQTKLNKEYGYHPLLSLVPLVVQILILFGLVEVIHGVTDHNLPGTEFLGMVPAEDGGVSWIMVILAGLSAVVMGCAQNVINPLQREQSSLEKNTTNGLSIVLSLVLGVFVATGMAFYWICSNLMSIVVQALCNIIIKPKKYIDYDDLQASREELEALNSLSQKRGPWWKPDPLAKREKKDYKRFFGTVNKHLVIYSEKSGFYKYYSGAIDWLLNNSNVRIHYVTPDPNDQIFKIAETQPRIMPYYIGEKKLITLFMKMDAMVMFTSLEDLETFYLKRSYVKKDTKYIFCFHHMTSTHLVARKEAYDNYNAILCVGPHQKAEIEAAEKLRNLPKKELVECGYDLLDQQIAAYAKREKKKNKKTTVLIAPSWQEDCILDLCAEETINPLLAAGCKVIVRPHPEYTKRYKPRWEALQAKYSEYGEDSIYFEKDFSTNDAILGSDILVTDWSSVYCEFSFVTLKPSIFINTPMKVSNPDWEEIGITPTDIAWRDQLGKSIDVENLCELPNIVSEMVSNQNKWTEQIKVVRDHSIYNLGHGAEVAGQYILNTILEQQNKEGENA